MPCASKRNFGQDTEDGLAVAKQYGIETRTIDLTSVREQEVKALETETSLTELALANIAPRLRMTTLYAVAASENRIVAGTGNRSEAYMGYFTKWGDGAYDFNFDGQTDEAEMGISYRVIDQYLLNGQADKSELATVRRFHERSEHKRQPIPIYKGE